MGSKQSMDRERDPIAELARLITQADPHGESAAADNRFRQEAASERHDEPPGLPPAPLLTVDVNEHEQGRERDEHCSDVQAHDVDDQHYSVEEEYQDSEVPHYVAEEEHQDNEVPRVRRHSLTLVMAIFGLALVCSACAVGYRNMFGGSVSPTLPPSSKAINERNTIAPVSEPQAASSDNTREIGPATTGSIDNMVSREDQPAAAGPSKAATRASLPRASDALPKQAVQRVAVPADPPGPPPTPPVVGSGYAVQVTSERNESRAQATFRALQAKYPNQLGGRQPIIRRADLGAAGIYYRALVGPFASAEKAAKLCSGLKAAGGDCVILKN
jgi:hypothetical protein